MRRSCCSSTFRPCGWRSKRRTGPFAREAQLVGIGGAGDGWHQHDFLPHGPPAAGWGRRSTVARGTSCCRVDKARFKREITRLAREVEKQIRPAVDLQRVRAHGVRYSVTVSSWSNLRMAGRLAQTGFTIGSTLKVTGLVTEFGLPVERARLVADITGPDGVQQTLALVRHAPGLSAVSS